MEIPEITSAMFSIVPQKGNSHSVGSDFATILLNEMLKSADMFQEEGGLNYTGMFRFQMAQKLSEAMAKTLDFNGLEDLKGLADSIAQEEGVDKNLVRAVIETESRWNHEAVSAKGAKVLMQLMDSTAERFGVVSSFNPVENIRGGVRFLSNLLERFGGDIEKVLAAYNAGEGAVERFGGIPPYTETREYVQKVMQIMNRT